MIRPPPSSPLFPSPTLFRSALQGFLVAKGKIPPLIATLAGFGAAAGVGYLITGGSDFRTVPSRLVNTIGQGSVIRSEEHTSELQSQSNLVCRLLLEKKTLYA